MTSTLRVMIGKVRLKNPVMVASGTFGIGQEYADLVRLDRLGGLVTKTITLRARSGNPPPRLAETPSGMLNSIGLENKGLADFLEDKIPVLRKLTIPVFVSIAGSSADEFAELAGRLEKTGCVAGVELNLSCPNLGHTTGMIAQDPGSTHAVVAAVRKRCRSAVIAKLSPKVADIGLVARSAEKAGADAICLINTFPGIAVDSARQTAKLGNIVGGLSGPALKPIALACVREAFDAVKIPLIGVGGVMTAEDAVEYILCGARAVQIGTGLFVDPRCPLEVLGGLEKYLLAHKIRSVMDLVGRLKGSVS